MNKFELVDALIETSKEIGRLEEAEAEGGWRLNSVSFLKHKQAHIMKLGALRQELEKILKLQ